MSDPSPPGDRFARAAVMFTVTQEDLDPRVRSLLEDAIRERDLDMDVAERLFELAQRLEGDELEETARSILRSA